MSTLHFQVAFEAARCAKRVLPHPDCSGCFHLADVMCLALSVPELHHFGLKRSISVDLTFLNYGRVPQLGA